MHAVLVEHGVFRRVHAADRRAVGHGLLGVAGAGALDEDDLFRLLAVGGPAHFAGRRARGREEALEGQTADHILVSMPSAILGQARLVVQVVAGGYDDDIHPFIEVRGNLFKVNGASGGRSVRRRGIVPLA